MVFWVAALLLTSACAGAYAPVAVTPSQENLERPTAELDPYYDVLIDLFERLPAAAGPDLRVGVIGSLHLLPGRLRESAERAYGAASLPSVAVG